MFATSHDDKQAVHEKMKSEEQHGLLTVKYSRKVNKMGSEREGERGFSLIMNSIFILILDSRIRIPPGTHAVCVCTAHIHILTCAHIHTQKKSRGKIMLLGNTQAQ